MTGSIIGAIIGVVFLVLLNTAILAYAYGKLTQRVEAVSKLVNNHVLSELKGIQKRLDAISERLSHIEGRLGD